LLFPLYYANIDSTPGVVVMINETLNQEQAYLSEMVVKLQAALDLLENTVAGYKYALREASGTLWEYSRDPDANIDTRVHRVEYERQLNEIANAGERSIKQRKRLLRMIQSPYFGRVDFRDEWTSGSESDPRYIGTHSFIDEDSLDVLIHDWRAPISGMFYDFELGCAFYHSPSGKIEGELTAKRQYKITQGELEFFIDTSLTINDDILQRALVDKSGDHMKNIVETIQREQNAIIRNDDADVLVIQGVAGSGKTSVALHRAAYMLYKYKETLKSADILIISPSNIFANYIADVLPQLGEDPPAETDMDSIAALELENICKLQTRYEQSVLAVEAGDERLAKRMKWKSRIELIDELDEYITNLAQTRFSPREIIIDNHKVPLEYIRRRYQKYNKHPLRRRLDMIYNDIREDVRAQRSAGLFNRWSGFVKQELDSMLNIQPLLVTYEEFFHFIGKPEYFRRAGKKKPEYSDAFPIIYLKAAIDGIKINKNVKHVIIDEMQDYAPIEYVVLKMMFPCKATILGDTLQLASPQGSANDEICSIYSGANYIEMIKSYRSTFEIAKFASRIIPNDRIICVERHGFEPSIIACSSDSDILEYLVDLAVTRTGQSSLAVICKTTKQAVAYHAAFSERGIETVLLKESGKVISASVMITTPLIAKGLEFDSVAIPETDTRHYSSDIDRQLLYIACTRAMHELILLHTGELTSLLLSLT